MRVIFYLFMKKVINFASSLTEASELRGPVNIGAEMMEWRRKMPSNNVAVKTIQQS